MKNNKTKSIEEKLNLFLEKNCPTDPGKWSASKSAAKSKFDVYPSAYANGWAAKNYKAKGGGWKTCNEGVELNEACWDGYKQVGGKMKNGRMVPNCVPISEAESAAQQAAIAINMKKKGIKPKNEEAPMNPATNQPGGYYGGGTIDEKMCSECGKPMMECECKMYEDINSDDDVNNGLVEPEEYDVEDEDMADFIAFMRGYDKNLNEGCQCLREAEYQGREVQLGKPMQGDVKKFKVYVKNPAGNVVKVNFGQKGMKIRKSNPAARKSFRARMNCDSPGPRYKANYWSCRNW
jgi:hypothetical protein